MVSFTSLSAVALLIASGVIAAPWHSDINYHTHRARGVGANGVSLASYHPPTVFETYGINGAAFSIDDHSPEGLAKSFLQEKLRVTADAFTRHAGHTHDGVSYEYFTQNINGIPVGNAVANVAMKDGKVVSYGSSFIEPKNVGPKEPTIDREKGIAFAEEVVGGKWNQSPVKLEYIARDDGSCALTYVVQVVGSDGSWKELYVSAYDGKLLNVVDFVADSSYHVVPLNCQDPTQCYEVVTNPEDSEASPEGWHDKTLISSVTAGNNVISYKNLPLSITAQSTSNYTYDYPYDPKKDPEQDPNVDAARVNTFYVVNKMHDLAYQYGFTESAYNFQDDNFDKGGKGNDRVLVSVQDASGKNNANFATPPDGVGGQMRMFTWNMTSPNRDGALENDIIVHEYTHGISNRLTGGGTGRCLQTLEAGGMGEGWSDAMAELTEAKSTPLPNFTLGSYVTGKQGGIRSHPYSTDMNVNPLTYGSLSSKNEVHAIGELWAVILHDLLSHCVKEYGIGKLDPSEEMGNSIVLHLIMDGFSIQPCNPTFIDAREAILQADRNRYEGKYKCDIWEAFARRGLGKGAQKGKYEDNFDLPQECVR
ncbi:Fungalysin metallopeptidase (M36) [Rhizoctonia solani]|uniref:Extracellular metalloproteinase n=1 Tax=Rhizoctonia solani TaxID=456999 RepID=A0A8H7H797_9AGAM|nr:Fungalysin metallopeptidase (M36) [Rhizoctonia solani]